MTHDPDRQSQTPENKLAGNAAAGARANLPDAGVPPILTQNFDAGSLYALRAAVAAHATQAGVPELRVSDIVLGVHELAANAIRHGAGHGRLVISEHDGALHCQVSDDGAPRAAEAGTETNSQGAASWPSEHGHGIWVVRQIADQVSLQSDPGGTIATASFTLPPPGAPAGRQRESERR